MRRSANKLAAAERVANKGEKLHTAPVSGVTMSPSTIAALLEDAPATPNLRARVNVLDVVKRSRETGRATGDDVRSEIMTRGEYANELRVRTTVTNASGVVVPQWTKDTADSPSQGGRLASLFRIREANEPAIGISEETGSRAAVVAPTDFGTALPESAATYTRTEIADSRFGAYMPAWKSILDDSQALADALDFVLNRDVARQIDVELLSGDGSGTAYGKHFTGLANAGLTAQNASLSTPWETIVDCATAIRAADWLGPITTIIHPTDLAKTLKEKDSAGHPYFEQVLESLRALDADHFVLTALATTGTAYVGSFSEYGTLYVRQAPSLEISDSDQSDFVQGLVKIKVTTRLAFRKHHGTAARQITNL
jgi:HK97 family phage major capsid protein